VQLGKTEELRARLQQQGQTLSGARRAWLEAEIQAAEERAKLLRLDIRLAAMDDELANWQGWRTPGTPISAASRKDCAN